jgi:hypothetical protein
VTLNDTVPVHHTTHSRWFCNASSPPTPL